LLFGKFIISWGDEEMPMHVAEEFVTRHWSLFSGGSSPLCVFNNIKLKYRQVVKYTTNFIRRKGAIIDYMFRPLFIRPSSGLAWRSKEELVQLYKVQNVHYLG